MPNYHANNFYAPRPNSFPVFPNRAQFHVNRQNPPQSSFPSQPIQIQPRPIRQHFPTNQQVFGKAPSQRNVFAPKNDSKPRNFEPMDTSSTHHSNSSVEISLKQQGLRILHLKNYSMLRIMTKQNTNILITNLPMKLIIPIILKMRMHVLQNTVKNNNMNVHPRILRGIAITTNNTQIFRKFAHPKNKDRTK